MVVTITLGANNILSSLLQADFFSELVNLMLKTRMSLSLNSVLKLFYSIGYIYIFLR